jgi:hypothetical protein
MSFLAHPLLAARAAGLWAPCVHAAEQRALRYARKHNEDAVAPLPKAP